MGEMKVLVVMGSPRKGNTYTAVKRIEEHLSEDLEFEYLMPGDVSLRHCLGCFTCFERGEEHCPIKDEAHAIKQQMHDADGVIFASPVYGMNVSGQFKVFVDRFSYIFHRPCFFDKKALLITTAGAIGHKEVLKYMDLVARGWGFEVVCEAGLTTPPDSMITEPLKQKNEKKLLEAAERFRSALKRDEPRKPSFNDILDFRGGRGVFEELGDKFPTDYRYWKERGWLDKETKYFVDVPVNPIYSLLGSGMEWFLRRQVRKLRAGS